MNIELIGYGVLALGCVFCMLWICRCQLFHYWKYHYCITEGTHACCDTCKVIYFKRERLGAPSDTFFSITNLDYETYKDKFE